MKTNLQLSDRVFGFFYPSIIRVYSPIVDIQCDVCKAIIPAYSFYARRPLDKGPATRKNPNANKCRNCLPFKVSKNAARAGFVPMKEEYKYVYDSYESFQKVCTPDKFIGRPKQNVKE